LIGALVKKTTQPSRSEWLAASAFEERFLVAETLTQPPTVSGGTRVSHTHCVHKSQMREFLFALNQL